MEFERAQASKKLIVSVEDHRHNGKTLHLFLRRGRGGANHSPQTFWEGPWPSDPLPLDLPTSLAARWLRPRRAPPTSSFFLHFTFFASFVPCNAHMINVKMSHSRGIVPRCPRSTSYDRYTGGSRDI